MLSAQSRVLSIPELFEYVLAHLPPRSLLLAQRISHQFRAAIISSPHLQRQLYFHATPPKGPNPKDPPASPHPHQHTPPSPDIDSNNEWTLNPLLREIFVPWFVIPGDRRFSASRNDIERLDTLRTEASRDAFLRPEASWRKMLVVQPAPKTLTIVSFTHAMRSDSRGEASIPFDNSVTMGLIYDISEYSTSADGSFGLSIKNSDTGPQLTLYLFRTISCIIDMYNYEQPSFRSRGSQYDPKKLEYKYENDSDRRRRYNMKWTSDLTAEKGGVVLEEWDQWKR
jgi:hypothetical protein